ncbi:MAG TPA: hypothetical protein VK817_24845 [Trebonia sp.]|jgi:hypothetical protein|nr:hypothetical protein [Trebonia sp.]
MPVDEQSYQPVLVSGGGVEELQHVAVHFQSHRAMVSIAAHQPGPGSADDVAQTMGGAADGNEQTAYRRRIPTACAWRRFAYGKRADIIHVKLQQFLTEESGQRIQPLTISSLFDQLKAQQAAH